MKKIILILILLSAIPSFGVTLKVFFSPKGGAQDAIIEKIDNSRKEILVAMYCFTSRPLANALVRAKRRGVRVKVMLDVKCAQNKYSKGRYLRKKGIMVKRSPEPKAIDRFLLKYPPKMHHKFAVIDEKVVITGSYNWTRTAEYSNWENLLIFEDAKDLALEYKKEFNKLWKWDEK